MAEGRGGILVVQNDPTCPLGRFEDVFAEAGVAAQVRCGFADDEIPGDAAGFAGVVVLGGAMGANDAARFPWLDDAQRLIRSAVAGRVPLLGICLGLQLSAVALGGAVSRNPHGRALGLVPLGPMRDDDPLLGGLPAGAAAIQWNDDVVTRLPNEAEVIAQSPDGTPQAVRFGPAAWGVQFHPEATSDIFQSWIEDEPGGAHESAATALQSIAAADAALRTLAATVAARFAALCRAAR